MTEDLPHKVEAFCTASIRGPLDDAARLLAQTPEIAGYGFAPAVVLGDAVRVRDALRLDPGGATRRDERTGWTPLHAACASRWHQIEPGRADGLLAVVRLLLDAGADPVGRANGRWRPLRCAIASGNSGPSNLGVVRLLLERGAVPDDHDLYLAGFAHDRVPLLRLLLARIPDVRTVVAQAFAAAVSSGDIETLRLLLDAGADPNRYLDDDRRPASAVRSALIAGCGTAFVELLLAHGAGETDAERFLRACVHGAREEARVQVDRDPGLLARLGDGGGAALAAAAGRGDSGAVALMLDLGFPISARGGDGATALHAAAYGGHADTVRLLLERGADVRARDTTWNGTPLVWAAVGSGEGHDTREGDWVETARVLIQHGASADDVELSPDDPAQPSAQLAAFLRGDA